MEFKDLPMPFQEMAANVVRSQLATLDLSTVCNGQKKDML